MLYRTTLLNHATTAPCSADTRPRVFRATRRRSRRRRPLEFADRRHRRPWRLRHRAGPEAWGAVLAPAWARVVRMRRWPGSWVVIRRKSRALPAPGVRLGPRFRFGVPGSPPFRSGCGRPALRARFRNRYLPEHCRTRPLANRRSAGFPPVPASRCSTPSHRRRSRPGRRIFPHPRLRPAFRRRRVRRRRDYPKGEASLGKAVPGKVSPAKVNLGKAYSAKASPGKACLAKVDSAKAYRGKANSAKACRGTEFPAFRESPDSPTRAAPCRTKRPPDRKTRPDTPWPVRPSSRYNVFS